MLFERNRHLAAFFSMGHALGTMEDRLLIPDDSEIDSDIDGDSAIDSAIDQLPNLVPSASLSTPSTVTTEVIEDLSMRRRERPEDSASCGGNQDGPASLDLAEGTGSTDAKPEYPVNVQAQVTIALKVRKGPIPMSVETYVERYLPKINAISQKMAGIKNKKDGEWRRLRKQWLVYTKRVLERMQEQSGDSKNVPELKKVLASLSVSQETIPT